MKKQKGFTLVEIAIVLVIVGLLLGGVLKGSEMIENARVRNVIQQTEELQAAVFAFQDRYQAQPGDMSDAVELIGGVAANCVSRCNDGVITPWPNTSLVTNHLSAAGFFSGEVNTSEQTANAGVTPTNAFGGVNVLVANWNQYSGANGVSQNGIYTGRSIPPAALAEIDRKVDDGNPNTGSFRSGWPLLNNARCVSGNAWLHENNGGSSDCAAVTLY